MAGSKKNNLNGVLALSIIIGSYALQHMIPLLLSATRVLVLVEAMAFTVLTVITFFLIIKSKDIPLGIIAGMFAFKIMPPIIPVLAQFNEYADLTYYIVGKVAQVLFLGAIIKLYYDQEQPRSIKPFPVALVIVAIPFFNELSNTLTAFADAHANGNYIYSYFISFACYSATMLIFLFIASRIDKDTSLLMIDYSILSASIRCLSKCSAIIYYRASDIHVSKSLFCWVAIYVFFIIAFILLKNKRTKK